MRPLADVRLWEYTGNKSHEAEKAVGILEGAGRVLSRQSDLVLDPFSGPSALGRCVPFQGMRLMVIVLTGKIILLTPHNHCLMILTNKK